MPTRSGKFEENCFFYCVSLHIYTVVPPKNFYLIRISKSIFYLQFSFWLTLRRIMVAHDSGVCFNLYVFGISARQEISASNVLECACLHFVHKTTYRINYINVMCIFKQITTKVYWDGDLRVEFIIMPSLKNAVFYLNRNFCTSYRNNNQNVVKIH